MLWGQKEPCSQSRLWGRREWPPRWTSKYSPEYSGAPSSVAACVAVEAPPLSPPLAHAPHHSSPHWRSYCESPSLPLVSPKEGMACLKRIPKVWPSPVYLYSALPAKSCLKDFFLFRKCVTCEDSPTNTSALLPAIIRLAVDAREGCPLQKPGPGVGKENRWGPGSGHETPLVWAQEGSPGGGGRHRLYQGKSQDTPLTGKMRCNFPWEHVWKSWKADITAGLVIRIADRK